MAHDTFFSKTMLARHLPSIQPQMTHQEALETTHIYSLTGLLDVNRKIASSLSKERRPPDGWCEHHHNALSTTHTAQDLL